jgi:hypothetical protein
MDLAIHTAFSLNRRSRITSNKLKYQPFRASLMLNFNFLPFQTMLDHYGNNITAFYVLLIIEEVFSSGKVEQVSHHLQTYLYFRGQAINLMIPSFPKP